MPKAKASKNEKNQAELIAEPKEKPFGKKLVLVHFLYSFFGAKDFRELSRGMQDHYETVNEENTGERVLEILKSRLLQTVPFSLDDLAGYSKRIEKYTQEISACREHFEGWKYFQYLALLFTEMYLDLYMKNVSDLKRSLNVFLEEFQKDLDKKEKIEPFQYEDLNVVAFWNATGSGKTLLMHINIKQYLYYHSKYEKKDIVNILLLTPNEGLSRQHLEEFRLSGMNADFFQTEGAQGGLYGDRIKVLDVNKLDEVKGIKTIAVESLEGKNLVLVDEGHRGSTGETWMKYRKQIARDGFSFEYSATFGQIISKKSELYQQYTKCILFDYSYKYFYEDGFGKEYQILNLKEAKFEEKKNAYLTSCMLTFLEQKLYYKMFQDKLQLFYIENPLMVFVGSTVIGSKTKAAEETVSDVVDLIQFLNWVLKNPKLVQKDIAAVFAGKAGLVSSSGEDIFSRKLLYLRSLNLSSEEIYKKILEHIFHSKIEKPSIHLVELKNASGEIGLKAGDSEFFGVINIGDVPTFLNLCEGKSLTVEKEEFGSSLFHSINRRDSQINILIGSKKFTEGWNSWRVSCMGLLNIGKNEGAQIIQLFGRGVRLRGYSHSLKRSRFLNHLPDSVEVPDNMILAETLNIFGIHADYIQKFQEYIEAEGVIEESKKTQIEIPVKKLQGIEDLKILDLKKGFSFSKTETLMLTGPESKYLEALQKRPIVLNWYTKIQGFSSKYADTAGKSVEYECHFFQDWHIPFLNLDRLYFELVDFKKSRGFYNLLIQKKTIKELLLNKNWYLLEIPEKEFSLSAENKEITWQEIALSLLQKYISRFYHFQKDAFESDKKEYIKIGEYEKRKNKSGTVGNLFSNYNVSLNPQDKELIEYFTELNAELKKTSYNSAKEHTPASPKIVPLLLDHHLYKPVLFHDTDVLVHISPSAITASSEKIFLEAFELFAKEKSDWFEGMEAYLLRNLSRQGISLFDVANFYPDFILWIKKGKHQNIAFIDPKGLVEISFEDPKIHFHKTIKEKELKMNDKTVQLHSFIVTPTLYENLRSDRGYEGKSKKELENHNILFMENDKANQLFIHKLFYRILEDAIPKPDESMQLEFETIKLISRSSIDDVKKMFQNLLPVYSFQAACGKFGQAEETEEEGWAEIDGKISEKMFIAQAKGRSMEPKIFDGDYIVFETYSSGTRQDRIILAQCSHWTDPETNTSFTVKKYTSTKKPNPDTEWEHESIILLPLNKNFEPIHLQSEEEGAEPVKVIAIAIGKYNSKSKRIEGF
ncbi:MAG TPA: DEAD/DEAH box helicase family protein [Leptospiraceae bacterium]|nr:DEAD/DEAH box helicase family protein [Leptospiraceae bacterium]HNF13821.1 DEAD/DEAH box helicase family protein [Leptospiraceae bacterium]